jgi:transcriptional regulator with XRE-family HTH domain
MPEKLTPEPIGRRIAGLRQELGLTQQALAERLAISRVAISHIEAGLTLPGERTIALLAGLFKCTPHQLVEDSDYPDAKAERLPLAVAWYTPLEMELALLNRDLGWLEKISDPTWCRDVWDEWMRRLECIDALTPDDMRLLEKAREDLRRSCHPVP